MIKLNQGYYILIIALLLFVYIFGHVMASIIMIMSLFFIDMFNMSVHIDKLSVYLRSKVIYRLFTAERATYWA